jgi:radical SAM protein with 4Fe4S-binding SPASM domain
VLKHKPVLVKVDPSTYCNLRCPSCHPDGNKFGGIMDEETFDIVMEKAPLDYSLKCTLYNFGEPLFNKNIYPMIHRVSQRGVPTSISTNFHIFNEKAAHELISSGLDWVLVCIDGATQDSYEQFRVGGKLERVIRNLELLVEVKKQMGAKKPVIEVQSIIFDHNRNEMDEIREMCRSIGVDRFTVKQDVITQLKTGKDTSPSLKPKRTCYFLYGSFIVDYDGVVIPCCLGRNEFGNLRDSSFEEIWNNEKFVAARSWFASDFKEKREDLDLPCYTCPLFF